jgi:hypothetical protein
MLKLSYTQDPGFFFPQKIVSCENGFPWLYRLFFQLFSSVKLGKNDTFFFVLTKWLGE